MLAWFDRHFAVGLPVGRFARNTVLLSLAGLLPVLAVYVAATPGFGAHLVAGQGAFAPFLRQILSNGLPVVVAINWIGLVLFARVRGRALRPAAALGLDFGARIGLFVGLHGVVFAGSAVAFGAFGGDPVQALGVLGPTLARAAGFGNLAGVYLYATLVTALPLHMALAERSHPGRGPGWRLLAAGCIISVQILTITALARLLSPVG